MRLALWIIQALMAAAFLAAGGMKLALPINELAAQMEWVSALPAWLVRVIGVAEVAGALGLIFPALLRVLPWLTPLAAAGLAVVMALASGLHLARQEYTHIGMTSLLFALLVFVAWGRFRAEPISARGKTAAKPRLELQSAHAN